MSLLWRRHGLALLATVSLVAPVCLWYRFDLDAWHVPLPRLEALTPQSEESTEAVPDEALWVNPWFMSGAMRMRVAAPGTSPRLWPHQAPDSDRIIEQLMFVPPPSCQLPRLRKVLLYHGMVKWWNVEGGSVAFEDCPVSSCTFTTNKSEASDADAILFRDQFVNPGVPRPARQVWILYHSESPKLTSPIKHKDVFNWTATYRLDSDIVWPYGRWVYYDDRVRQKPQSVNYAANKTKKVAWFVSNCYESNQRQLYAHELQKHIQVDIFGKCGTKVCNDDKKCFKMLDRDYKFYLAFENSNCRDYITEKFYVNALRNNILPIVMGARPEDYERGGPEHSYIHVDEFASAKDLAAYLHLLDADDELYNSYFGWKGTGEFLDKHNSQFFCRLCALLHDEFPDKMYRNINKWWRGSGICTKASWRN